MIKVRIDTRLRLPRGLPREVEKDLRAAFTHANPEFSKKKAIGFTPWGMERQISMFVKHEDGSISVPRGGTERVRRILREHEIVFTWDDARVRLKPVDFPSGPVPTPKVMRDFQSGAIVEAGKIHQGIVRAPTGSGKTTTALATIAALRQPALVVVNDSNLLKQWKERAINELGLSSKEIGILQGGKKLRLGPRLTLALQQTLASKTFPMRDIAPYIGTLVVDEVQGSAAKTFLSVVDNIPAYYRLGYSADETRKDGKEFLIYDTFGRVIHETFREELEEAGFIVPVRVRLVPTTFEADWYRDAAPGERDFNRYLGEATRDEERNALVLDVVKTLVAQGQKPIFVFTHRIEHAEWMADVGMFSQGIRSGLMLGGKDNSVRFEEDKERLSTGEIDAAAGTYKAIGTGIDVPDLASGIMTTPIGNNPQFFNQVRGRICRPAPGKTEGFLYVIWDRLVFPEAPSRFKKWNRGNVEILGDGGRWVPFKR